MQLFGTPIPPGGGLSGAILALWHNPTFHQQHPVLAGVLHVLFPHLTPGSVTTPAGTAFGNNALQPLGPVAASPSPGAAPAWAGGLAAPLTPGVAPWGLAAPAPPGPVVAAPLGAAASPWGVAAALAASAAPWSPAGAYVFPDTPAAAQFLSAHGMGQPPLVLPAAGV